MAQVFGQDGQPIEVPDEQVQPLFMSGQVGMAPGSTHPVLDPRTGTVLDVPAEDLHNVLSKGYQYLGASGDKKLQDEKDFGGPMGQAEAFAGSALNAATLSGSDVLLNKLGVSGERLKAPREVNPTAAGLGTATGIVAPMLIGDEAGALSLLGKPAQAVSHLGEAVAPAATSLAGKIGSGVVRGGVEGSLYGLSNTIDEAILDDKPLTVSSAMHGAVSGALLGGGLSGGIEGALGIAQRVAPATFERAAASLNRLADRTAPEKFDPRVGAENLAGSIDLAKSRMDEANATHKVDFDKVVDQQLGGQTSALSKVAEVADQHLADLERPVLDANPEVKAFTQHIDLAQGAEDAVRKDLYDRVLPEKTTALLGGRDTADDFSRKFANQIADSLGKPAVAESTYKEAGGVINKLGEGLSYADNDAQRFNAFRQAKRELDDVLPRGRVDAADERAVKMIKEARDQIKSYIHNENVFGEAAKMQKAVDTAYAGLANSRPAFANRLLQRNTDKFAGQGGLVRSYNVRASKVNKYLNDIVANKGLIPDEARAIVGKHADRMGQFFDVVSGIAGPTDALTAQAQAAKAMFSSILPKGEASAQLLKDAKALKAGPLSKLSAEDKKIANIYTDLKTAKTDAEAFKVAQGHYDTLLAQQDRLSPRMGEVRDNLRDVLTDKATFGNLAEHFDAVDTATRNQQRAAADLRQEFFKKGGKIAGQNSPTYVDPGKAQNYINAEAKNKAMATVRAQTLDEFQKASKEALAAQAETYHLLGNKFVDGDEVLGHVNAIADRRQEAVSAKRRQFEQEGEKPFHVPMLSHEGGVTTQAARWVLKNAVGLVRGTGSEAVSGLARHAAEGARAFSEGLDSFFAGKTAKMVTPALSKIAILTQPAKKESPAQSMVRIQKDLSDVISQPGELENVLAQANPKLARFAPESLAQLGKVLGSVAGFLTKGAPPPTKGFTPPPSAFEVAQFQGMVAAAFEPLPTLLAGLKSGTLTQDQCKVIQTGHPELWSQAVAQCAARYARAKEVPYQSELALSLVLGQPLAAGLNNVSAYQSVFKSQQSQGPKPHLAHASPASAKAFKTEVTNMSLNHPMSKR